MVPFPSEYSSYTSASGPQAPFGAPAPAEPTHGSNHFNDILQKLTTPAGNTAAAPSDAPDHAHASTAATKPAAADATAPSASPLNADEAPTVSVNSGLGRGKSNDQTNDASANASVKDTKDSKSATSLSSSLAGETTLVTPAVTVLTPRQRAAWANAPNAPQNQNSSQQSTGDAPAPNVAAAVVAASVASSIPGRVQVQAQPANANSKSQQASQPALNAIANVAAVESTAVPAPAAKFAATPDASSTPTAQAADSNDPSASTPMLAALLATAPAPLPEPSPTSAKSTGGNTAQNSDETGVSSVVDAQANQAKTAVQNRQPFATRAQLSTAAFPQTAGAPSLEEDDVLESATSNATSAAADAALTTMLRQAAANAVGPNVHGNTPASTPANMTNGVGPAQLPQPQVNVSSIANAIVTSATGAKPATAAPIAAPSAAAASAPRPALTMAMPDLVGGGFARAMAPIQIDAPAPLPADVDASAVMSQIVQAMRVQLMQGGGTAQVTLQPGYLGGVTLNVKVDQDSVTASVVADTPAVREALRTQEPALRDALTSQGLRLDQFDVAAPSETPRKNPGGGQGSSAQEQRQPRQQKRRDSSEPAFEFVA